MSQVNDSYPIAEVDELAKKAARLDACINGLKELVRNAKHEMETCQDKIAEQKTRWDALRSVKDDLERLLDDLTREPKPPVPEIKVTHVPRDPERTRNNPIGRTPEKG